MRESPGNAIQAVLEDGRIGDRIFSINGVSVENLTEDQIRRFWTGDLVFSRDEDESIALAVQVNEIRTKILGERK